MRLLTLSKMLVFGATAALAYKNRDLFRLPRSVRTPGTTRGRVANLAGADLIPDPGDPVQGFDEAADLHVSDLDLDAMATADAEAAQDLASLSNDFDRLYDEAARDLDTPSQTTLDAVDGSFDGDVGELYGVHTPTAVDTMLADDRAAMDEGQNWIEALETSAVENGAEPEHELDVMDEMDRPPHPSDTRDTPVADRGSGGPSGV